MKPRARRLGRILLRIVAACALLIAIAAGTAVVVVQSGWFHEYVRKRVIAEIERATGARVEIGRFSFRGSTLTATVAPLVLHGREGPGEPPLARFDSVNLTLRIISVAERKADLASVQVEKPRVRIAVYPDGTTNLPGGSGNYAVQMIDLAVQHYQVDDGVVDIDQRNIPVNLRGDGLGLKLTYDPKTPSYLAELRSRGLRVVLPGQAPVELAFSTRFALEKSRVAISALHVATPESRADLKGNLENPLAPRGTLNVVAAISVREAAAMFSLPVARAGSADFTGALRIDLAHLSDFTLSGAVNARGIGYSNERLQIAGAQGRAQVALDAKGVRATRIHAEALGAQFEGMATIGRPEWRRVHVEGSIRDLTVAQAAAILTPRPLPWNGTLSGDVMAEMTIGEQDAQAQADLDISPAAEGAPIQGRIAAAYDQRRGELVVSDSLLETPATRLEASGTLGRRMTVQFRSTDPGDVLAALPLIDREAPELPLGFRYGSIAAHGVVTGPLDDPHFRGQVNIAKGSLEGHAFDAFDAQVDLAKAELSASRFTLARGATQVSGTATLTAHRNSFDDAGAAAQFNFRNANIEELMKEAGGSLPVKGTASGTARVSGTLQAPQADITLSVANPQGFGETMDRASATLQLTRTSLEISSGEAADGPGRLTFSGDFRPSSPDWRAGEASLQMTARTFPMTRVEAVQAMETGLDARLTADLRAQGQLSNRGFTLSSASGNFAAQSILFHGQPVGELTFAAETQGQQVSVNARGSIDGSQVNGSGSWSLAGDQSGSATVRYSRMDLEQAHRFAMLFGAAPQQPEEPLPLEGFLGPGSAAIRVALSHPRDFQASVQIDSLQFNPRPGQALPAGVPSQDVVLRNAQPVVADVNAKELRIEPSRLTGTDTNLDVSGTVPFTQAGGADIAVRGAVNLVALQLVSPNLLARGNATVEATLRGDLTDPSLNGRMDLRGASLYLKDVPTGLDNVNGGVLFNRTRATIDKLTAQLGSGTISLGGFVEFGAPLVYRLQASAQQVRVRLPIDLSATFNANLALGGTSDASTLSGTLTLNRAAFNPGSDLDQLFAAFSQPLPEVSPNDYLRGMQFDVRVVSAVNFELQTALTRDVQAEVDLRLRGTPVRPLMLGSVSVESGQVQFFGNQYTIDRGDIRFTNPVKLEPVFDVVLDTRVSGVAVSIAFTGPIDRLRTNYSSDPPLESSKIVALLAVGRDPTQYAGASSATATSNSTNFVGAGGSLLTQALSAQLSSKLQRFLGASRVKIDPTMTGVDNTPQARLTFEQQVSKDVTMTYITNLNYTQEQIVRLQWDFTPKWSAIAVRDANGLFGIDFQYRKSFK